MNGRYNYSERSLEVISYSAYIEILHNSDVLIIIEISLKLLQYNIIPE